MKRILLGLFSILLFISFTAPVFAQVPSQKDIFSQASIVSLSPNKKTLEVRLSNNKTVQVTYEPESSGTIHVGDTVVVGESAKVTGQSQYYFVDQSRTMPLILIVIGFFVLLLLVVGWKGIGSIAGLLISLGVIFFFILPQIIAGNDPLIITLIGAVVILFVTTLVAHGISKQTIVALVGTLIALVATYFLSQFVAHMALLTGFGNEEAVNLQFALPHPLNLQGLYLSGIILATLGALNDITITQATAIFSLGKTNTSLGFKELATEGYTIGREHALSLVNTLLLAFAGTSLALFIFLVANPNGQPLWVILNSESLVEEIVQIIAGTAGLLLAVPIVTILAALVADKNVQEYFQSLFK